MAAPDPAGESPLIARACVQYSRRGKALVEFEGVHRELLRRGAEIEHFTRRDVFHGRFQVPRGAFVVGEISALVALLDGLGAGGRLIDDDPSALNDLLRRRVWCGTLEELWRDPGVGLTPVFVKPRRRKRFPGRVTQSLADLRALPQIAQQDEFLCAEVVTWIAEYRAYVLRSKVLGVHFYAGSPDARPDPAVAEEAVRRLNDAGQSAAGYCLDLGVLDSGETCLVEVNDAIALRNYGLSDAVFTDLLFARWQQLANH